jgi:hypothetical protein
LRGHEHEKPGRRGGEVETNPPNRTIKDPVFTKGLLYRNDIYVPKHKSHQYFQEVPARRLSYDTTLPKEAVPMQEIQFEDYDEALAARIVGPAVATPPTKGQGP